jgi:glycine/D-amino acid oxidase-like deaminating enzyme
MRTGAPRVRQFAVTLCLPDEARGKTTIRTVMKPRTITRDDVQNIVNLAEARNTASAARGRAFSSALEYTGMSPEAMKLNEALEKLGKVGRRELAALFWIGRGDFKPDQFTKAFDEAYDEGLLIHYLRAKIQIGETAMKGYEKAAGQAS